MRIGQVRQRLERGVALEHDRAQPVLVPHRARYQEVALGGERPGRDELGAGLVHRKQRVGNAEGGLGVSGE